MIRVNPKIMAAGVGMLVAGTILVAYLGTETPTGRSGMTDEEVAELMLAERQNSDYSILASMMIGVGFLLILVSLGTAKGEGVARTKKTKKPAV